MEKFFLRSFKVEVTLSIETEKDIADCIRDIENATIAGIEEIDSTVGNVHAKAFHVDSEPMEDAEDE